MPQLLPLAPTPQKLIENRRSFGGNDIEFSIYDTYQEADMVELQAQNPLYCGMITGKKVIHFDGSSPFEFLPNESLVIPSSRKIHIDFPVAKMDTPTQCITIEIARDKVKEIVDRMNDNFPRMHDSGDWRYSDDDYVHFENTARFNQNLDQIIHCFTDKQPFRDLLIDLNTSRLIIHMLQSEARKLLLENEEAISGTTTMQAVVKFIRENLHRRIQVEELEKVAHVSKATLFRNFKNELGCSPVDFINTERMKRAAKLLRNGKSVTETCYNSGYKSLTHFTETFKKQFGITPNHYKQNYLN